MQTVVAFLIVIGILIFAHELGHFLAARWMNVKVLKFSLGFGPKLIGRKVGDTEYLVSAFPLGGYVKLLGEEAEGGESANAEGAEVSSPEDRNRSFSIQPVWKRAVIVGAGPLFNFVLAYLIFVVMLASDYVMYVPTFASLLPNIESVAVDSPAEQGGMKPGDKVVAINGREVSSRNQMLEIISERPEEPLDIDVERGKRVIRLSIVPERKMVKTFEGEEVEIGRIGVESPPPVVGSVVGDSPAGKAGFKPGDRIVSIDGRSLSTWAQVTEVIYASPGKALAVEVERGRDRITLSVTPETTKIEEPGGGSIEIGQIGIILKSRGIEIQSANILHAAYKGVEATYAWTELTVVGIGMLITGQLSLDNIGSPIMIAQVSGSAASQGALSLFMFIGMLSINLGIINMIPIPPLDGGHLMFFSIEAVQARPVSERKREIAQQVGIVLLILLMLRAFYNDIDRWLNG
jgi:regulator of sigma E protease